MFWHFLDIFFIFFHTALIIFNLFGWIWKKSRRLNMITLMLTGASWSLLGLITGTPGYCPLTDLHFIIVSKLGESNLPASYIKYLADRLTGLDINSKLVDKATLWAFIFALAISLFVNIKGILRLRQLNR